MRKQFFRSIVFVTAVVFATMAWAEMRPRINVDFVHAVNVGTETLPAGHYTFQQVDTKDNAPIFRVMKPDGTNVTLTAIGMSARVPMSASNASPPVASDTDIVLQKINGTYYLDKIWIAGHTHGWAFDIPDSVRSQAREMQQETVKGNYDQVSSTDQR